METLANLESFMRSAEAGSFSAAARRLSLTPAAVSRNVATLERNLGVRLFQRSTRHLVLTEAGERFLAGIGDKLEGLQAAIADIGTAQIEPVGVLKISLPLTLGMQHILPLLPAFLARYPAVRVDWHFDNRQVDLISEGYDAAIGGGLELASGIVVRKLAPAHIIAVASPGYMTDRKAVTGPGELDGLDGIVMRSSRTGRIRHWPMRGTDGREVPVSLRETVVLNDPAPMIQTALMGLGVAMLSVPDVLPHLDSGALIRLAPGWYADAGAISLYHASRSLLPRKTRVFADFVTEHFRRDQLAERFSGSVGSAEL
jgi:DNA-binding transcriptional LysR family regulator